MDPLDDLRSTIDTFGWAVRNDPDPDSDRWLTCTVGLTAFGHPEVVMTGLPPEVGTAVLTMVNDIVSGTLPWEPGYANPPGSQRLLVPV